MSKTHIPKDDQLSETDLPQPSETQTSDTESSDSNLLKHHLHRPNLSPTGAQSSRFQNRVLRTKFLQALRFLLEVPSNLRPTKFETLCQGCTAFGNT